MRRSIGLAHVFLCHRISSLSHQYKNVPQRSLTANGAPFSNLNLPASTLKNLKDLGYLQMTSVQEKTLPLTLANHDVISQAATGSGKTAAFSLPLLQKIDTNDLDKRFPKALVLCPTRELAGQVSEEIRRLARAHNNIRVVTLCGGASSKLQAESLETCVHVVVGTPGRVFDHLERGRLSLDGVKTLVFDEADRMMDMGFLDSVSAIAAQCPRDRQTLMFSATFPDGILKLAAQFLRAPKEVRLTEVQSRAKIQQVFYRVNESERYQAVEKIMFHWRPDRALAFCNTKASCNELTEHLRSQGVDALALHGDLEQRERDNVVAQLSNRSVRIVVATDVAARGLDIPELEMVINVDVSQDPELHTHRVGRTGRADAEGWALSLVCDAEREALVKNIADEANGRVLDWHSLSELSKLRKGTERLDAPMTTLHITGGRKNKIRAGDIVGVLTGPGGLTPEKVGKIAVGDVSTYVAVAREAGISALRTLNEVKVKGVRVKAYSARK